MFLFKTWFILSLILDATDHAQNSFCSFVFLPLNDFPSLSHPLSFAAHSPPAAAVNYPRIFSARWCVVVGRLAIYHARRAHRNDLIISKIFDVRVVVVNFLQQTRLGPRWHVCDRWNDCDGYKTVTKGRARDCIRVRLCRWLIFRENRRRNR